LSQEPPVQPGATGPRDAKAELKAAKAYSKAQRPWYKKKRWIISIGLLLLIVAVSAGGTGTNTDGSGSDGTSASGGASKGKSGSVGQALENAGTTYEVTNASTASQLGDPSLGGARADGMFVVVDLSLTNNKDETKTFTDSSARIETSDGKRYETSDKAVLAFGDESLLLKDIQPDLTAKGKLAFDLPPGKVSGSTLVVEDLYGSGEVKVDLGL
jgi:Domain of unknown function (DUF4352)